jgi:hypothetical protein
MKVHSPKVTNYIGIQGLGLISLLKETASVIPIIRTKGLWGRVHWSPHVHVVGANDHTRRDATIQIGPA